MEHFYSLLGLIWYFQYNLINDILHMSFLAGTHIFKAFPAYTTTELWVRNNVVWFVQFQ